MRYNVFNTYFLPKLSMAKKPTDQMAIQEGMDDMEPKKGSGSSPDVSQVKGKVKDLIGSPENGRKKKLTLNPDSHEELKVGDDGMTKIAVEPCPERGKESLATRATCGCGQEYVCEGEEKPLVHPDDGMIKVTYYTPPSKAVAYKLTMVVRGDGPRQIWDDVRLEFRPDGTASRNGEEVPVESALKDLAHPLKNANFGKAEQRRAATETSTFKTL